MDGKGFICSNSPLAFYATPAEQNHRKDYAFGNVFPILTPLGVIPPFQFVVRDHKNGGGIVPEGNRGFFYENIKLVRLSDGKEFEVYDLSGEIKGYANGDGTLTVYYKGGPIQYKAGKPVAGEGLYYLYFEFNAFDENNDDTVYNAAYSEVFCMSAHTDDWLTVTYANTSPLRLNEGQVRFDNNFAFKVYLDTQVGRPKYNYEEEASERMGYTFVESQVSKKTFGFTALAPEYLCDALRLIRLCDRRVIRSRGRTYYPTTFEMDAEWEEQGDVASVKCSFDTDTVVCNVGGYAPAPALKRMGFNNDFNLDFD